jgi:hypothetical protein
MPTANFGPKEKKKKESRILANVLLMVLIWLREMIADGVQPSAQCGSHCRAQ